MTEQQTIDVSKFPMDGTYYVIPEDCFVRDADYRDFKFDTPVWSIGRRRADGKILASCYSDLFRNTAYDCLWLR